MYYLMYYYTEKVTVFTESETQSFTAIVSDGQL